MKAIWSAPDGAAVPRASGRRLLGFHRPQVRLSPLRLLSRRPSAGASVSPKFSGAALIVWLLWPGAPRRDIGAGLFFLVFPIVAFVLLDGWESLGLPHVDTLLWGGVFVTLVTALVGIVFSLPLGVLLALGRRSHLPVVRLASVIFIEFVRGVPFITVLFMANNMLPLFLPAGWEPDRFLRPLVGIALFSAAYMAEEVRGGLQSLAQRAIRRRDGAGAALSQHDAPRRAAAGAGARHSRHRQQFHRPVQGYDPGGDRRHQRLPRDDGQCDEGYDLERPDDPADRLRLRGVVLFRVLLCDVALFGEHGAAAGDKGVGVEGGCETTG